MAVVNAGGVNDRGRFRGAESGRDDDAVGEPIEFGRYVATSVTLGNDEAAIGGHAAVAPIARNLMGQGVVKSEAPSRQRIEWTAGAPVERHEALCRRSQLTLLGLMPTVW
jgi:hypothetical protein